VRGRVALEQQRQEAQQPPAAPARLTKRPAKRKQRLMVAPARICATARLEHRETHRLPVDWKKEPRMKASSAKKKKAGAPEASPAML
jgi:hypothetical protein